MIYTFFPIFIIKNIFQEQHVETSKRLKDWRTGDGNEAVGLEDPPLSPAPATSDLETGASVSLSQDFSPAEGIFKF